MAIDTKKADLLRKALRGKSELIRQYKDFVDADVVENAEAQLNGFEKNLQDVYDKNRILRIGIIGAMKAGKSSFLNTCLFDGEDLLPKSCIPMTAALTKISYSSKPHSVIHFYEVTDWNRIKEKSDEYDAKLNQEYENYIKPKTEVAVNGFDSVAQGVAQGVAHIGNKFKQFVNNPKSSSAKMTFDEFRKKYASMQKEETLAYKQMTESAKKRGSEIFDKLGQIEEIDGCSEKVLNQYIGAEGKYTPLVNYIEIFSDSQTLKELAVEIVDTPGLNDPITSRGYATKQFLKECDVVLLLSPCSQFMDQNTVELMINKLPSAIINDYLVVGSKFDSALLDYKKEKAPFKDVYLSVYNGKISRYKEIVRQLLQKSPSSEVLKKLFESEPVIISSTVENWANKINPQAPVKKTLDESEQLLAETLKNRFDFDADYKKLKQLSGITVAKKKLIEFYKKKDEIIEKNNGMLISQYLHDALIALDDIIADASRDKRNVENGDVENMKQKIKFAKDALNSSRKKMSTIFEVAANGCQLKMEELKNDIVQATKNHVNITTESRSHDERDEFSTGFLGLSKEVIVTHVTDYYASTAQVVDNLSMYIADVKNLVSGKLRYAVDSEKLKKDAKETMLKAFSKGECPFDEDDILNPLERMLSAIIIPQMSITSDKYIDRIKSEFPDGHAKNESIHTLKTRQSELIVAIQNDLNKCIDAHVNDIKNRLTKLAESFTDDFEKKMVDNQKRIWTQIANKEENIAQYESFIDALKTCKESFKELQ